MTSSCSIRQTLLLPLIIPALTHSTEIRDSSCCFCPAVVQHGVGVTRIQDPVRGEAGAAANRASVADRVELGGGVRVGGGGEDGGGGPRPSRPAGGEDRGPPAAVDLQ